MRSIVKICKATLIILLNLAFLFVGLIISLWPEKVGRLQAGAACMSVWAACSCAILGIRIRNTGVKKIIPGALVVANHCSYLDILVLGSLIPGVFIAKQEVSSWPLLGLLSRFAGTIFVDRSSKMSALSAFPAIEDCLISDVSVLLFPEGTTNNGTDILAFKSSFFKIPVEGNNPILPVSLNYSHINRTPIGNDDKDRIAWYGDMSLLPHLWNILGMKQIDVRVHFNPAIRKVMALDETKTRKLASSMARESVITGYQALMTEAPGNLYGLP